MNVLKNIKIARAFSLAIYEPQIHFSQQVAKNPVAKLLSAGDKIEENLIKNGESTLNPIPFFASTVRSHRFTIVGESVGAYLDVQCVKKLVSDLGGRYSKKSGLF